MGPGGSNASPGWCAMAWASKLGLDSTHTLLQSRAKYRGGLPSITHPLVTPAGLRCHLKRSTTRFISDALAYLAGTVYCDPHRDPRVSNIPPIDHEQAHAWANRGATSAYRDYSGLEKSQGTTRGHAP